MKETANAYIGTFTDGANESLYHCTIDTDSGRLELGVAVDAGLNPSFLAVGLDGDRLYTVNETDPGTVTALEIDDAGRLSVFNRVESGGKGPTHVAVDATGSYLLVSDYHSGVLSTIPLTDDGGLAEPTHVLDHGGDAKVHAAVPGPDNQVAYVAVLGADAVLVYDMDLDTGRLLERQRLSTPSGAGPRNIAIHPDGTTVYVLCETRSLLLAYDRNTDGTLSEVAAVETIPASASGENYPAEVQVHDSGEFLFVSNRGQDTIATFGLEDPSHPSLRDQTACGGSWPRHFTLSPDGDWLFVANENSDDVRPFSVGETGELKPIDAGVTVPNPVCLVCRH